jgi:hypothetical protein
MNCDDVFVILTRGPFPSGSPDDHRVEAHLLHCADCQRLAEALRPNDSTRQESMGLDDGNALPGYWGESPGASSDMAISLSSAAEERQLQRAIRRPLRAPPPVARNLNVWQFAAAVTLGIFVAATLRTLFPGNSMRTRFTIPPMTSDSSGEIHRSAGGVGERELLLNLPAVCRRGDLAELPKTIDPISLADDRGPETPPPIGARCCTSCHHSGSETKLSSVAKVRLEHSCVECHSGSAD